MDDQELQDIIDGVMRFTCSLCGARTWASCWSGFRKAWSSCLSARSCTTMTDVCTVVGLARC